MENVAGIGAAAISALANENQHISLDEMVRPQALKAFGQLDFDRIEGNVLDALSGDVFRSSGTQKNPTDSLGSDDARSMIEARMAEFDASRVDSTVEQPLSPENNRMMDMLKDVYIGSIKMKVAWTVVQGISKDVKTMLQAQ